MPVKRRFAKRRFNRAAELAAWSGIFECGHDFFGDLDAFGFESEKAAQKAAHEAWRRLGADFLASWTGGTREPWALSQFGKPRR